MGFFLAAHIFYICFSLLMKTKMTQMQEYYPLNIFKDEKCMHVMVLSMKMCADLMHAWCPQRPKEGIRAHGYGLPCGSLD